MCSCSVVHQKDLLTWYVLPSTTKAALLITLFQLSVRLVDVSWLSNCNIALSNLTAWLTFIVPLAITTSE